ncbi:hypothetical protein MASR1M60_13410 [Rhodocyclaceae bacterium]
MISERFEGGKHVSIITCDRCGKAISDDGIEMQERFAVRFKAGYASVFGDENIVEGDFCQTCIHEVLGQYCRVREGDRFSPGHRIQVAPEKIYQPDQLPEVE